ncbi:hypothetical protein NS365_21675 [Aureimonas ureilytica]|uniref:Uncharacterized protein n=1 Tax=Aureimonas ureilytica TaxID=401562 RepID=A0A175RG74_9HYPH|nr:hypothetical protein NS365_21675 [Aureimonas ureilytica]
MQIGTVNGDIAVLPRLDGNKSQKPVTRAIAQRDAARRKPTFRQCGFEPELIENTECVSGQLQPRANRLEAGRAFADEAATPRFGQSQGAGKTRHARSDDQEWA